MMTTVMIVAATLLVLAAAFVLGRYLVLAYARYRDSRIITCPDTGEAAMVEVDAVHAALTSLAGQADIRLKNCWRWPINERCGQECLTQLEVAPPECLVSGVLMRWYGFKSCVFCEQPFEEIRWMDHKPALRSPEGSLFEWCEIPLADIERVMRTYSPVCWDCYVTQSFLRDHPELVVFRPRAAEISRAAQHDRYSN